jgi:plasmid maintenance system antidote protein VapI
LFGRFLSAGPEFWMNLQALYDIKEEIAHHKAND